MTEPARREGLRVILPALLWTYLCAVPAVAQDSMSDVLTFLVTNHAIETADFERDRAAAEAARDTISRALVVALATQPLTSSSAGFAYAFNPALGTVQRTTESFSPFLIERALTAGIDQGSLGATWRMARFTRLQGHDLRNGGLVTVANQFTDEAQSFDEEALTLDIRSSTFTVFGTYGVTSRLEVGAIVPFVQMEIHGQRVNTYRGEALMQAEASAQTRGLGDIAVRAKYHLYGREGRSLAAAADIHLPTGRERDLLGAGRTAITVLGIVSVEEGATAAHVNGGFTRGGVSNEIRTGGAVAVAATPQLTVSAELLGRHISALHNIVPAGRPHPTAAGVETMRLLPDGEGTRSILGVTGVKWNVAGTWLVTGNLLWSLSHTGLTAPVIPTVAVDYSF